MLPSMSLDCAGLDFESEENSRFLSKWFDPSS